MRHLTVLAFFCVAQCAVAFSQPHPEVDSSGFRIRGVLPWHNFLSGPTAWNLEDYRAYLDDCKAKEINFIGFHNYTGGGQRYVTYVEPMIKIEYKNILPEAYLDNSLTARWGYTPRAIGDFAFNTPELFHSPAPAFGADCSILASSNLERYQRAQELMRSVMALAHERGMQVAMGFEFGVHPPEYFSMMEDGLYWAGTGTMIPNPTHYQAIEILYATIDNIIAAYPDVDWIWLWLNEHSFFGFDAAMALSDRNFKQIYDRDSTYFDEPGMSPMQKLIGVWSMEYMRLAYDYLHKVAPGKKMILGGWGGSDQLPAILKGLDRGLPADIVFSCLNPGLGQYAQPAIVADIARHRRFWSIPWLEGDNQLWHFQPRVKAIREQVKLARDMKLDGVVAIHWRTEETRVNFGCFSRFARSPLDTSSVESMYFSFMQKECGTAAANELAGVLARCDEEMWMQQAYSPEYYAYTPDWGRLDSAGRMHIKSMVDLFARVQQKTADRHFAGNIAWFKANLEFALLLDEVGSDLEPAYLLRSESHRPGFNPAAMRERIAGARKSFAGAPIEQLFLTYAGRVRSRGELGVLSSMNQKLFNEYQLLKKFLDEVPR